MRYTDVMTSTHMINVSRTEAYDLSESIAEIQDRFGGENWSACQDAASEHARREARDIAELDGLSPAVQDAIEDRLHDAAFDVAR